jgi:hypothetical protein
MPARPPDRTFTDHRRVRQDRGLKGQPLQARPRLALRNAPTPPVLARLTREHTERSGTGGHGRPEDQAASSPRTQLHHPRPRHRATPIDGITPSDGEGQEERAPTRRSASPLRPRARGFRRTDGVDLVPTISGRIEDLSRLVLYAWQVRS